MSKTKTRKTKKPVEANNFDALYAKLENAMRRSNHKDVIKIGSKIVNNPVFNVPPVCWLALGEAYVYEFDNNRKSERQDPEYQLMCKQNAYKWLDKARGAGLLDSPELVNKWARMGCERGVYKWHTVYHVVQETIEKIKNGTYPPQPDSVMHDLYMRIMSSAGNLRKTTEGFEAACEAQKLAQKEYHRYQDFSNLLFGAMFLDYSAQDLRQMSEVYSTLFKGIKVYSHDLAVRVEEIKTTGRRIRVGYVSPNCNGHVALQFFYGLLKYADREKFEVTMYSLTSFTDEKTEAIARAADHFYDIKRMHHEEAAEKIYNDGIDILVDLAGHTGETGLPIFAHKPAPVQMTGIGYLATTGLKTIDYYITDKVVDPPGLHEDQFTEKLLYLTSQFSSFNGLIKNFPASDGAPCKKNGYVTFGVFNRYNKITDTMIRAWAKIMELTPGSKLLLKGASYYDEDIVREATEHFASLGMDVSRVMFEKAEVNYMPRYLYVDIALDTYPYTGGGTTVDAIYMGVPVVSLYGERRNTRFSLGILVNVGLNSLAVDTLDKYIEVAVTLAKSTDVLDTFHKKLRAMMLNSVVGRPDLYTKELEEKYLEVLGLTDV